MRARLLLLALAGLGLAAAPTAAQPVPSKCIAAKYKATAVYVQAILGCEAKAAQTGEPVDPECMAKAIPKLEKAFARAEKKGDCNGSQAVGTAQNEGDGFRIELGAAMLSPRRCCAYENLCGWEDSAAFCAQAKGTTGAEGSSCDGAGACVAEAVGSGPCCSNRGVCNGGPVGITECTAAGGAFVENGRCLPSGECLAD